MSRNKWMVLLIGGLWGIVSLAGNYIVFVPEGEVLNLIRHILACFFALAVFHFTRRAISVLWAAFTATGISLIGLLLSVRGDWALYSAAVTLLEGVCWFAALEGLLPRLTRPFSRAGAVIFTETVWRILSSVYAMSMPEVFRSMFYLMGQDTLINYFVVENLLTCAVLIGVNSVISLFSQGRAQIFF